jgi:hypothetical protein
MYRGYENDPSVHDMLDLAYAKGVRDALQQLSHSLYSLLDKHEELKPHLGKIADIIDDMWTQVNQFVVMEERRKDGVLCFINEGLGRIENYEPPLEHEKAETE